MSQLHPNTIGSMKMHFTSWFEKPLNKEYQQIVPEYDEFIDRMIQNKSRIVEYGDFTCIHEFYNKYNIQYPQAENYGLGSPTIETQFGKLVNPINSWISNLHKERLEYNKKKIIIENLKNFGVRVNESYNQVVNGNFIQKDDLKNLKIEDLENQLKEYQTANSDSQNILNDEYVMNQLVSKPNLRGWIVNRSDPERAYSVNVTEAAMKLLKPEIDRRIMQRKIDAEAKRRIYEAQKLQKELDEKQKFEDAVRKRMQDLGVASSVSIKL